MCGARWRVGGRLVHAVFFEMKRAYQSSLGVTRRMLAPFGLTPARFDMLYAIRAWTWEGVRQSVVRRMLGVSPPTVSRMMEALDRLGLVTRVRATHDTRQRQ